MWWNRRLASWMCSQQMRDVVTSSWRNLSRTLLNLCHKERWQLWRQPGSSKVYLIKWPTNVCDMDIFGGLWSLGNWFMWNKVNIKSTYPTKRWQIQVFSHNYLITHTFTSCNQSKYVITETSHLRPYQSPAICAPVLQEWPNTFFHWRILKTTF